jgi:hypothetical protein
MDETLIETRVVGGSAPYSGQGILTRDVGRYPPAMRNLLDEVGNETITKITLFKYPLVEVSALAKFFSNRKVPYDELFHLGMLINDKYKLDKDEVLHFVRGGIPTKPNTKTMNVDKVPTQPKLTINALLEQTRLRIGNEKMTEYNAFRNNCQDFIKNLLITGNWSTPDTTKFIHQNAESFLKDLPKGTELITNALTKVGAVIDKVKYGEGIEEDEEYEYDDEIELELEDDGTGTTTETIIPISNTEGIPPATSTDFFIRAPSGYANPDLVDTTERVIGRTLYGGSWGVDGKERPYFGSGVPTTSNFKMYGQRGGAGINYAETKVNEIGNEQRNNIDTAIPKRLQELSLQNYQIRGGSSGLTYAEVRVNPNRDYLLRPIDTQTYPKF